MKGWLSLRYLVLVLGVMVMVGLPVLAGAQGRAADAPGVAAGTPGAQGRPGAPAEPPGAPAQVGTVLRNANLRAGPSTRYAVVGSAPAGTTVRVAAANKAGDWYQLTNGRWIAAFLVDLNGGGRAAQVPTLPPTPAPAHSAPGAVPAQGATEAAPDQGATGTVPAQGATGTVPAQGATGAAPAQGATEATPAQGATGTVPAQGATGTVPAQGATAAVPDQGATAAVPAQGATGTVPAQDAPVPAPAQVAPPAPAQDTPVPAAAGNEFVLVERRLWDVYENGGWLDGPSVHCGDGRELVVTVLDANGSRLNGVAVQVQYGAREIEVTGAQGKGDGVAEFVLGGGQDVQVVRNTDGSPATSELATGLSTNPGGISQADLIAARYCQDEVSCRQFVASYGCGGHFSWSVTFQRR